MKPYDSKPLRIIALVMRILLGLLFIVSALSKFFDMDTFEVYVFSYGLLSLNLSFIVARLVIICEILIGIGLISNIWNRFVNICTMLMLVGFTLFLGYAALIGRTDSCHCMGPLMEINPTQSILKNAILILWLIFVMRVQPWKWQPRWFLWMPAILAPIAFVFIVSAPDNWLYPRGTEIYNAEVLDSARADQALLGGMDINDEGCIMAFLTPGCPFCKLADQKLTAIFERHELDSADLVYIIPGGDSTALAPALDTVAFPRAAYKIPNLDFLKITYGQRPMVLVMKQGQVIGSFHYRNIEEKLILDAVGE